MAAEHAGLNGHRRLAELAQPGSNAEDAPRADKGEEVLADGGQILGAKEGSRLKWVPDFQPGSVTVFRVLRSVFYVAIMLIPAVVLLTTLAPPLLLVLRPLNRSLQRRIANYMFGLWLHIPAFIFEKLNRSKVIFTGDNVPHNKRLILICNHRTEVDWIYIWNFAIRKKSIGSVKYALKSSVRNYPIFGWIFHCMEFLYLDRKWESDQKVMHKYFSSFQGTDDPIWFVIFPEGTDFSEEKKLKSQKFSKERGLPCLEHVLLPRVKGFSTAIDYLGNTIDCVYDVTMAYDVVYPTLLDNLLGISPSEVHIHVRKIPMLDFPKDETATSDWLYKTFEEKDKLLDDFFHTGKFSGDTISEQMSFTKCALITLSFNLWSYSQLYLACYYLPSILYYMCASALFLAAITFVRWLPQDMLVSEAQRVPKFFD